MSIQKTIQIGDKILRQKANVVRTISGAEIQKTIKDLVDSMRYNNLVGMAAPQIGKKWRIFVSEIRRTPSRKNVTSLDPLRVFINPKIIWRSKKQQNGYEGCGSVFSGQLFAVVKRPQSVACEALDKNGNPFKIKAAGLLARVIQHEADHLDGIIFTDRVSDTRTIMNRETYISLRKK